MELNKGQLLNLKKHKVCNYYWFDKYDRREFDNIKIIINNKKDTVLISKYEILCYFIYYSACMLKKYKQWNLTMS